MATASLATTADIITAVPSVARPLDPTATPAAPARPPETTATVAAPARPPETTATATRAGTAAITAASQEPCSGQSGPAPESGTQTRIARTPRLAHAWYGIAVSLAGVTAAALPRRR